ncbi:hypothetical protein AB0O91_36800 [Kitasatospora sp. NPDC089797]|uniref:hypothetical protein n=1 Tax=Kitasatospora sp. NPDC089797 TaxID=3155298 RepID=UPI003434D588
MSAWHHDVTLFGEPYPTRNPVPDHFRTGDVTADELMGLPREQRLAATAAHELGHALLWAAAGLRVGRVSIVDDDHRSGHAMALSTGVPDEARLLAVGTAGGERAEDRWLREAGLWTPDRAAVVELSAHGDRARLLDCTSPRPVFGTGGPDFAVLHDMADEALDRVWGRLMGALPVLVRRQALTGQQLASITGLPLPAPGPCRIYLDKPELSERAVL